jgi:hypothetical protein
LHRGGQRNQRVAIVILNSPKSSGTILNAKAELFSNQMDCSGKNVDRKNAHQPCNKLFDHLPIKKQGFGLFLQYV